MNIWQIATGEPGRDYRELFLDYDIMILGPSQYGDARNYKYQDGVGNSSGNQVHRFTYGPKPGDRIIMRFAHDVIGIGQIPAMETHQYSFEEDFFRVYGWDLCHCRRVIWAENYILGDLANVFKKAKQKPSFTQVHEKRILDLVKSIESVKFERQLKDLPSIDTLEYKEEELGIRLFRAGISNKNIDDILKALEQADRLCSWYKSKEHCGRKPTENEIVSHTILPLFLGLGWSHQQIAVEWHKVDMAFFIATPTTKENCVMILEAKGLGQPLTDVLKQPLGYIQDIGIDNANVIVTTDGENLFVYKRKGSTWKENEHPEGYISVTRLQKEYILPKKIDLVDTLVMLQPTMM
ncbi:MAG: hypothetical protein ACXAB4_00585 [Candidatus Hodarchaeales archaeon]